MQKLSERKINESNSKIFKIAKIITISFIIIGVFIVAFLGVFFPKKSQSVIIAQKAYAKVDDAKIQADSELINYLSKYHYKEIPEKELLLVLKKQIPLTLKLREESEVLKEKYENSLANDKVFGFRSIKIFFGHLGMPVVATALGLYLLLLFFKEESLFFRKVTLSFSIIGLVTGLFYLTWVFYPSPDVPEWAYILLLLLFSFIGTIIAYFIGRYTYNLSEIDLVMKTQNLLRYIILDIKKKYISKQDRQEYISDYLGEIEKLSKK